MEVPTVSTGHAAPTASAPAPESCAACSPSFDEALAAADAELDVETVASDSSLAALAALLSLAAPVAAPVVPTTPAPDAAQTAAEVQSLNWALAPTAADPAAASAERLATLTESVTPPAPQAGTIDESAASLTFAGALGAAEPDAEPAPQPPEAQAEAAVPKLRLLRELDDTPIIHSTAPTLEPARLTEAHPTAIEIPESAVLVQVERVLESLSDSANTPNSVRVQLQPESLGRIELRVTHGEHGLRVTLTAENAATGQLLERRLDDLRQTLVASGVEVSGLSVSVGNGQADARSFLWQRPAFGLNAVPVRAFGDGYVGDDYGSASILVTAQDGAHRAALTGVDYRI